ncbi:MAG: PEP-CTERM sorting domain-containing protein [Okeania sp. SIO2C2]|uniref:PEP-CTERM sorting domain-containing protein n=1 Tax=Okeania sp. SIO2C2 TaxID=2607787 RepID=UPI0013BAC02A|nr:PEP-CTERM sorting domain-containing protein [Okeania sp. SIO2C2]NEP91317.1 PEP-CTERM sorting domain-containing protein [Okeania sp. SIO2C2]
MKTLKQTFFTLSISAIGSTFLTIPAKAIDFNFSFNNELNGGGAVTGIIRGLDEGTGAASSVEVLTNTTGLGIGEYVGSPLTNSWTVLGEEIIAFDFLSAGVLNTSPAVTDALIFFDSTELSGASFRAGIAPSPGPFVTGSGFVSTEDINLTFTAISTTPISTDVPEPSSILGFGMLTTFAFGKAFKRK